MYPGTPKMLLLLLLSHVGLSHVGQGAIDCTFVAVLPAAGEAVAPRKGRGAHGLGLTAHTCEQ